MEIKSVNPRLKRSEIAKEMKMSSATIQPYRSEIFTLSPYRIPPSNTNHIRKQKTSKTNPDDDKMISNDL